MRNYQKVAQKTGKRIIKTTSFHNTSLLPFKILFVLLYTLDPSHVPFGEDVKKSFIFYWEYLSQCYPLFYGNRNKIARSYMSWTVTSIHSWQAWGSSDEHLH